MDIVFSQLKASLKQCTRAVTRDKRGAVLIYTALAAPVFIGTIGLSIDVAGWQAQKRQLQSIADAAAIGGALERIRSGTQASVEPAALVDAETNGYVPGVDDINVFNPPQSGIRLNNGDSVEVIVRRQTPTLFSHIIMPNTAFVSARAVAVGDINDTCVWALNQTSQSAVKVSGAAVVDLDCGIFDNSNDDDALTQSGAGCLSASSIKTVGNYNGDCISTEPITGANPISDPLEGFQGPTNLPACTDSTSAPYTGSVNVTLNPCVFTGNLTFNSDGLLHFNPGLYVFDGAGITFGAQSTVTGTGVHFYLTENNNTPSESFNINAGSDVTLSAGITDDHNMKGILIYHDRDATGDIDHWLTGGANMDLDGILYFPSSDVKYAGGTSFDTNASMIIADEVEITGNTNLGDFDGSAVSANKLLIEAYLAE